MEQLEARQERKYCSRLGWALVVVMLCSLLWSLGLSLMVGKLMTHVVTEDWLYSTMIGSILLEVLSLMEIVGHYLVTLPLAWLICRRLPRVPLQKELIGVRRGGRWFVIGVSLLYLGGLIGRWLNGLALQLSGRAPINVLGEVLHHYPQTAVVIATCVVAPICEETLFRGLLANRLARYGEWQAALASGLLFGLYHGNLEQFFYAFALGVLLAYAYFRSGRLLVPIVMHMLINLYGSGVGFWIEQSDMLLVAYALSMLIMTLMGVVIMVRRRDEQEWKQGSCDAGAGVLFGNTGMVIAFIAAAAVFVLNFILM